MEIKLDVNNFRDFTPTEYRENLLRLGIVSYSSLVGKTVYYIEPFYGKHKVVFWDSDKAEFLLEELNGDRFWCNPFRILNCN